MNDNLKKMSDDELTAEQRELNLLLKESNEDATDEQNVKKNTKKRASNDHLIDFDPLNNDFNEKENWFMAFSFFFLLFSLAGFTMIVISWNRSKQNNDLLNKYQAAFEKLNLSNWAIKCYSASASDNPCNVDPTSEDGLFNWQTLSNYHTAQSKTCSIDSPQDSPCLEIENKFNLLPNFTDPNRIDFADDSHLFSLSSLVFPNTNNNNQVKNVPFWQQSTIRTLPATRFVMNDKTNLNVVMNNIYAIQLPVIVWSDLTNTQNPSLSPVDYCQTSQLSDIIDNYPLFMLFNPYLSAKNGTVPTFSICTCLMGGITNSSNNPVLWNTMCVDASTFTLST